MSKKERPYKRLPGTGRKLYGYHHLWQGPDHLLLVEHVIGHESYRRFFFKDIQAITVRKTHSNAPAISLALLLAALMVWMGVMLDAWAFHMIAGAIILIMLAALALEGSACQCTIQTATQIEELSPLKTMRKAKKALGILKPLIEQAQGGRLDLKGVDDWSQLQREESPPRAANPRAMAGNAASFSVAENAPLKAIKGWAHQGLYALCLASFAHSALALITNTPYDAFGMFLSLGFAVLMIAALVRQSGSTLPSAIKKLTVAFLIVFIITFIIGFIQGFIAAIAQQEPLKTSIRSNPLVWANLFIELFFGVYGSLLLHKFRKSRSAETVPQPFAHPENGAEKPSGMLGERSMGD